MKPRENNNLTNSPTNMGQMHRRKFCVNCVQYIAGFSLLAVPGIGHAMGAIGNADFLSKPDDEKIKKVFIKKGSCSHLLFYMINKDYENNKPSEEMAIDQLAGGIGQLGYQCGMLWGSSMAAGTEAYRQYGNKEMAKAKAIMTTQQLMKVFEKKTKTLDCRVITDTDLSKFFGRIKLMFSAGDCFELAEKFVPKAIDTTRGCFEDGKENLPASAPSCASELLRKMNGTEEEMVMVAGFAGGLGLSGNGCGALSAAIWKKSLDWCRENPGKTGYSYKGVDEIILKFEEWTGGELLCNKICGKKFNSIEEHGEHVFAGGCGDLIDMLSSL